jgi:hypothetical protein
MQGGFVWEGYLCGCTYKNTCLKLKVLVYEICNS